MNRKWASIGFLTLALALGAYFSACGGGDDVVLIPPDEGGEYWFVSYNIRESSIGSTVDEIFSNTTMVSKWGTMSVNSSSGEWTVFPGTIYNASSAPFGLAMHAHRLTSWNEAQDEGYYNPQASGYGVGNTYTVPYTIDGNRAFLNTLDGAIFNGAFSRDFNAFVGMNMEGQDSEIIYAIRKPYSAPAINPNGKYLNLGISSLGIKYASVHPKTGVLNGTDHFSIEHNLSVSDKATDNMLGWGSSSIFMPQYAPVTNALEGWSSGGPHELSESGSSGLDSLSIRADGLADIPNMFIAIGASGSGLFAGDTVEEDSGDHVVSASSFLEIEPSPTLSDLEGTWIFTSLEGKISNGSSLDWGDADEELLFYYSLMEFNIDSGGNMIANSLANKWAFDGTVEATHEISDLKMTLSEECYKPGTSIYAADCTGGITIPVYYINTVDAGGNYLPDPPIAKIAIDRSHNLAVLWEPIDEGGVPCNEQTGPCTGDALPRFQAGPGVKYK